jgi:hypothetical protein
MRGLLKNVNVILNGAERSEESGSVNQTLYPAWRMAGLTMDVWFWSRIYFTPHFLRR